VLPLSTKENDLPSWAGRLVENVRLLRGREVDALVGVVLAAGQLLVLVTVLVELGLGILGLALAPEVDHPIEVGDPLVLGDLRQKHPLGEDGVHVHVLRNDAVSQRTAGH
jgi:hypothetical protein